MVGNRIEVANYALKISTVCSNFIPVQCRAAWFIFQDYKCTSSVTNMLHTLEWPTLEQGRVMCCATMMFKIINSLIDIPVDPPIFISNNCLTRGHQPYLNSFFPNAIRIWNSLPRH